MNDRFKIRVITMGTKEIIYVDNYYWFEENGITEIDNNGTASGHTGEYWINQSTGKKDKNGKLIYEDDILQDVSRVDKPLYVVYRINDSASFGIKMINPKKYELYSNWHINRSQYDYVVVGNIYKNPELLEKGRQNE